MENVQYIMLLLTSSSASYRALGIREHNVLISVLIKLTEQIPHVYEALTLYGCPNCPSCSAHLNSTGWAIQVTGAAIKKYILSYPMVDTKCTKKSYMVVNVLYCFQVVWHIHNYMSMSYGLFTTAWLCSVAYLPLSCM